MVSPLRVVRFNQLSNYWTSSGPYDKDTKEIGVAYKFETLATIGIENIKVEYTAENYSKKFINISYNVDNERSTMYEKTKYTFYKKDGKTQINLTEKYVTLTRKSNNTKIRRNEE